MKIAVSACLLGEACRYDGKSCPNEAILEMDEIHELVPICPELLGGLSTPRSPAEIQYNGKVVNSKGEDVTQAFYKGACEALRITREHKCTCAILKENSPSCGCRKVHDGSFSGTLIDGRGVTATFFSKQGIMVFSENELDRLRL